MKVHAILSYVLSILEGGLSGVCFYRAGQAKERKHKVLLYISSAAWFILSVLNGMAGAREWKAAQTTESNGGNDNE